MTASEIRQAFKDFFESKSHVIVPSAPMVIKDDPTLMFTNAGMNQFKDLFLGNSEIKSPRVADSQKCLRVSGKHNDLEEVGHDTYHHTMFEMLGNWSFGDYFKKEAIDFAWEFLVEKMKISKDRLYATVFEGAKEDNQERDNEAADYWAEYLPQDRIINGNKKDNFWEMGDVGPCGPCSEVHVDIRSDEERAKVDGRDLVNMDHPHVIEIWNLVFIQFNRKSDGSLEPLPNKHVDTGMGFERLCMVVQDKQSNYDTDVFQDIIAELGKVCNVKYGDNEKQDIAMRVIADHVRTIAFSITDGQLPGNAKAGYVIRRILRRAVRYGYTFLDRREAFMCKLIPALIKNMGDAYPELLAQESLITKVIKEEEDTFLRTLEKGIKMLDGIIADPKQVSNKTISGKVAFELYDTFGFPLDLTELILKEKNLAVNLKEFEAEMDAQKNRARNAAAVETGDWTTVNESKTEGEFCGYDTQEAAIKITRYRKISAKGKELYQLVFDTTPFYAESGGQVGDTGYIEADGKKLSIVDTKKENNLIVHIAKTLPSDFNTLFKAVVGSAKRKDTENNHSATHLLHEALREVLGSHVEQKGSLVTPDHLRFDFAHFQKLSEEELTQVEKIVNDRIRANYALEEFRAINIEEAKRMGAMALFGEKYGDTVRAIKFGSSIELCGGTHVASTGQIGMLKIISEGSISAGIRRIEAVTGTKADAYVATKLDNLDSISQLLDNPKNVVKAIETLMEENTALKKQVEAFKKEQLKQVKQDLLNNAKEVNGATVISAIIPDADAGALRDLCFQLKGEVNNLFAVLGGDANKKPCLSIIISDNVVKEKGLNAGKIIREAGKAMKGGGGGQPFFATAGGKDLSGLQNAIDIAVAKV